MIFCLEILDVLMSIFWIFFGYKGSSNFFFFSWLGGREEGVGGKELEQEKWERGKKKF